MKRKEMQFKKFHLLEVLLLLNLSFPIFISKQTEPISYCGSTRIPTPIYLQNTTHSSILNHMLLCKSEKLYFRTSLGLFQISSIDYSSKLLTVSHSSCSSTSHFVSPTHLTAGLPHPPQPNSLVFFNCWSKTHSAAPFIRNCTYFGGCGVSSSSYCSVFEDAGKLDLDFHPEPLNCTHYSRMYRNAAADNSSHGFELGTRISFDIPDHVPNPCDECKKPQGNCGVGLRCICHPKECKDKVISSGVILNPFGGMLFLFLSFSIMMLIITPKDAQEKTVRS